MSIYDFKVKDGRGKEVNLTEYTGRVVLIVNTATKCGFAGQFKALESLHLKYQDQKFDIVAFPCDQFLHQEPVEDAEMSAVCKMNHGVTFPFMAKIKVKGASADPLYKYLTRTKPGFCPLFGGIKWNFTKFLVNAEGKPIKRFGPHVSPYKITGDIDKALAKIQS